MATSPSDDARRLDEIRARVEAATREPWCINGDEIEGAPGGTVAIWTGRGQSAFWDEEDLPQEEANATFIAHAPSDVRTLLAEVERLREALDLIQRCVRNSREAPNVFETIEWAARRALNPIPAPVEAE